MFYKSNISVKNTIAFRYRPCNTALFPFQFIVIADLHDFIAFSENNIPEFFFFLFLIGRIQPALKQYVKIFGACRTLARRSNYLNFGTNLLSVSIRKSCAAKCGDSVRNFSRAFARHKEKIIVLYIKIRIFSVINCVSISYNQTRPRLSENLPKHYRIISLAAYNITKNIPRSDRRKLIRISYKEKSCTGFYRLTKCIHKKNINHRRFIHYNYICIQRIVFILLIYRLTSFRILHFKHSMNSACFMSGRF